MIPAPPRTDISHITVSTLRTGVAVCVRSVLTFNPKLQILPTSWTQKSASRQTNKLGFFPPWEILSRCPDDGGLIIFL